LGLKIHLKCMRVCSFLLLYPSVKKKSVIDSLDKGGLQGGANAGINPPRRCGEGLSSLHPLLRRGFSGEENIGVGAAVPPRATADA
jgi:hypothetical protein